MKKLLQQLPLILGCLFLAGVMVLMIRDVTIPYQTFGTESGIYEYDESEEESSFLQKSTEGLYCIVNSFVYAYNDCGYYDYHLSYIQMGKQGYDYLPYGFIVVFAVLVCLLCLPVLVFGYTMQIYAFTGGIFALILLLGEIPQYGKLILLVMGWVYINLSKYWMCMKGEKNLRVFWREFPAILFPVYGAIILLIILMPVLMPGEMLPKADRETKEVIFNRLQEIRLVSDQYEENKKQKENQMRQPSDQFPIEDEDDENDNAQDYMNESQEEENQWDDSEDGLEELNDRQPLNNQQDDNPDLSGDEGQQGETGDGKESIFTLNSGGGVSRGRTDLTGNLKFNGTPVLTATMDRRPEKNLYIRLFYAEDYKDNRWKQAKGNSLDDISFYSLRDGGPGVSGDTVLHLKYPDHSSDETVSGSSRSASLYDPELSEYLTGVCMEVPEELENLFREEFSGIFQESQEMQENNISGRNEEIADRIEKVLEETAYYTLSPGSAPKHEDFIKWFLTENKKGYCMHFASAGVMMLRAAGVSSRYTEGYVVSVSAWEEQEDGSWRAEILDSNAHAWAEIYQENDVQTDTGSPDGYWVPVELTPAYRGELAGSFAGQQDAYVGKTVIPGLVVWIARLILRTVCIMLIAVGGMIFARKFRLWHEYRMLHTGDAGQDIINMMRILLKKPARKNGKIRKVFKKNYLTRQELNEEILCNVPQWNQDRESREWFEQFSIYVYRAAFDGQINEDDRKKANVLYKKLRKKLVKRRKKTE